MCSSDLTQIINDEQKWKFVRSHFRGVKIMTGTSTYFTDKDTPENTELFQDTTRSLSSYLVEYIDALGQTRFSYVAISALVPRIVAQLSISHHIEKLHASSYIAAELELYGSGCLVRDKNTGELVSATKEEPYISMRSRRDHYIMVRS